MINKEFANQIIGTAMANNIPLQLAKLIACQSAFETNNFISNNFIKDNNGFGYKYVKGGIWQSSKGGIHSTESDHYAAYATFDNSIIEVCKWINRRQKEGKFPSDLVTIQLPSQYAHLLKACGFYGALEADYANGISKYLKQLNEN